MAIFTSDQLANGGLPVQSNNTGTGAISTKIVLPAGTALAINDVLKFCRVEGNIIIKQAVLKTSDLDTGTSITAELGYVRPTVDPSKAFDATTNPYLTGAIAADDPNAFGTVTNTTVRTGGSERVGTGVIDLTGVADVALTITASPAGNPNADRFIEVYFEYIGKTPIPGEFSGGNAYNYTNETA